MIVIQRGSHSRLMASSLVNTVRPSVVMPGGTKGSEPVATITSRAEYTLSMPLPLSRTTTRWGPCSRPLPRKIVTPARSRVLVRLARIVETSWAAWSAIFWRSKRTGAAWMPKPARCSASANSRTRPLAASNALEGTQPRLTQVPPISRDSTMATLSP